MKLKNFLNADQLDLLKKGSGLNQNDASVKGLFLPNPNLASNLRRPNLGSMFPTILDFRRSTGVFNDT